jgi:hypothetical protein
MKLEHVLQRLGVVVRHADNKNGIVTLLLRVPQNALPTWVQGCEEFLLAAAEGVKKKKLKALPDISKSYFIGEGGRMLYLWRVVMPRDGAELAELWAMALQRTMAESVDVTEMPLVGRREYTGETRGVYPIRVGPHGDVHEGQRKLAGTLPRA